MTSAEKSVYDINDGEATAPLNKSYDATDAEVTAPLNKQAQAANPSETKGCSTRKKLFGLGVGALTLAAAGALGYYFGFYKKAASRP
jgi:hypothetical protein